MPFGNDIMEEAVLRTPKGDPWTVRNAVEGVQIFGGIGSGKTSGSGRSLATQYLRMGFGGLVLTVKPDETNEWIDYAAACGRSDDLVILSPDPDYPDHFDFMVYEASRAEGSYTTNLVQVLKTVIQAGQDHEGSSSGQDDAFWQSAMDLLIHNLIDLIQLGQETITLDDLYAVSMSIPVSSRDKAEFFDKYSEAQAKLAQQIDSEKKKRIKIPSNAFCEAEIAAVERHEKLKALGVNFPGNEYLLGLTQGFFDDRYIPLADKTRSIIEFSLIAFLSSLQREPVRSLFCSGHSTVTPEECISEGKIIILDLPVKTYDKVGRDAQILFKYIWQRAMERRNVKEDGGRPVFLWADEAQNFLHEHDIDYQATARSSRVCTVYITQNINNYYAHLGGRDGDARVKSFLGTMATKIFHANADVETNRYASDLIGDHWAFKRNRSISYGEKYSETEGETEDRLRHFYPEDFIPFKTGGLHQDWITQAVIHKQGAPWPNEREEDEEGNQIEARNHVFVDIHQLMPLETSQ